MSESMQSMIGRFCWQLDDALGIAETIQLKPAIHPIQQIYIAGLGGSGIGGSIASDFVRNHATYPIHIGKGYEVPAWVNKNTLAIVSSYSGNTEETLVALKSIQQLGAHIVCISSGGKLQEIAEANGLDFIQVPDDWASPRACLGYSIIMQLTVLTKYHIIDESFLNKCKQAITLLTTYSEEIKRKALQIALLLQDKIPIIYSSDKLEGVAIRFRQQLNENSKILCWHHVIPEMNHNELVGWKDRMDEAAVIFLRSNLDHPRNQLRAEINKDIIRGLSGSVIEIFAKGDHWIEQSFYLIHLCDWVSVYLADQRQVDAVEVNVINYLKGELNKHPIV